MRFEDLMGHKTAVKILKKVINNKSYSHAYVFSGPSGVGKTTIGRIFAKAILCDTPVNDEPCNICESCVQFNEEKNFNFKELDAASFGGKDDMVKLRDDASFFSVGKKKIILIDECHDISRQGQDALLKQLEQCPDHLIYIFCTTELSKMNETLLKRCMTFQFSRIDTDNISGRLRSICEREKFAFDDKALEVLAEKAKGQVRDAIQLLDKATLLGDITLENVRSIVVDYDNDVYSIISNLGVNLSTCIDACKRVTSRISVWELYELMLSMLSDSAKMLYGYENFQPQRKALLERLKDQHGFSLLEFLNYLIQRDKHIDKIGLQSDIILLHYKFCSNSFKQQAPVQARFIEKAPISTQEKQDQIPKSDPISEAPAVVTHTQLLKMSDKERSQALRDLRKNQRTADKVEKELVPNEWPLPKEERLGENSFDDKELTPEEFSQRMVGGRKNGF